MKKNFIVLTASSLLIGTLGVVGAQSSGQNTQSGGAAAQSQTQSTPQMQYLRGFGRSFGHGGGSGFGGLPFGHHLALGTTVTLEFYNTDPSTQGSESGGTSTPQQTLTFTYGQDSEAAFAQSFAEARANASYMTVAIGEQTQTLELPSDSSSDSSTSDNGNRRGGVYDGAYGLLPLRGLNEGSSVTATFYDGDPEANAQELQTLSFTYGQDSEAGFADQFASAAQNAAYVTLTTSPQTYTVDLTAVPNKGDMTGRGGNGDFDGGSREDFRGGFGHGGPGRSR